MSRPPRAKIVTPEAPVKAVKIAQTTRATTAQPAGHPTQKKLGKAQHALGSLALGQQGAGKDKEGQ